MNLIEVLRWIALTTVVLAITMPTASAIYSAMRTASSDKAGAAGCGCFFIIVKLGFVAAIIACVIKAVMKYLL